MDLQMPVMDGYEAVKELRKSGYIRPIIALTAHALKQERHRCLEAGFNDHLSKPVDRDALLKALLQFSA
jgi:CheY-like chemotaxis protein